MAEETQEITPEQVEETVEATTTEEPVAEETQPEAEETEEVVEEDTGEETAEEAPKKKGISKRFSDLTAQRKAAEQYAQRMEETNRQLMDMMKAQQPQQPPEVVQPVPTSLPDRYDFDDDAQYQAAVTSFMDAQFNQRFSGLQEQARERKQQEVQQERQRSTQDRLAGISTSGAEKYEDFAEVAYIPNALVDFVAVSEHADELAYRWGQNPAEAQELLELSQTNPYAVAAKIGRLDAELSARTKTITKAPPPVKPVGSRSDAVVDDDKLSMTEWVKKRNAELEKRK
jgi:hypothetical protein